MDARESIVSEPHSSEIGAEHTFTKYNENPHDWGFKVTGHDETHVHVDSDSVGGRQQIPKATYQQSVDDLKGIGPRSAKGATHPAIAALANGQGQHIGKGNDSVVWKVGDHFVKRASPVPYHPIGSTTIHHDINEVNRDAKAVSDMSRHFRDNGIKATPTEYHEHEGRAYLVQPAVDTDTKMNEKQVRDLGESVKGMHDQDYEYRDQLQAGLDDKGDPSIFDLGSIKKGKGQYAEEDDAGSFHRFAEEQGSGHRIYDKSYDALEAEGLDSGPESRNQLKRNSMPLEFDYEHIENPEQDVARIMKQKGPFDPDEKKRDIVGDAKWNPKLLEYLDLQDPSGQQRMFNADPATIQRFAQQMGFWDESQHPREKEEHTDDHGLKEPGEFAPKEQPGAATAVDPNDPIDWKAVWSDRREKAGHKKKPGRISKQFGIWDSMTKPQKKHMLNAIYEQDDRGKFIAELDAISRSEATALMSIGLDPAQEIEHATNYHGQNIQIALSLIHELVALDVDTAGAGQIGDDGEPEYEQEAMQEAYDYITWGPGETIPDGKPWNGEYGEAFPEPLATRNYKKQLKNAPQMTPEQADATVEGWKQAAQAAGQNEDNSEKIVISLFDYTGAWSQPWRDAGYQVIQMDLKLGMDFLTASYLENLIEETGGSVVGVMSACPCITMTRTGMQWWPTRHDMETPEMLAKVFGPQAPMATNPKTGQPYKSALEYNVGLYDYSKSIIEKSQPEWHALENPATGRFNKQYGKYPAATDIGKPRVVFDPNNFGGDSTKETGLWGEFNEEMPTANRKAEGSKIKENLSGSHPVDRVTRSLTPEGFAYSFFVANHKPGPKKAQYAMDNALIQRFSACWTERFGQRGFWDESKVSRETEEHTDDHGLKEPGEFAPKPGADRQRGMFGEDFAPGRFDDPVELAELTGQKWHEGTSQSQELPVIQDRPFYKPEDQSALPAVDLSVLADDPIYKSMKIERYEFGDDKETHVAYRAAGLTKVDIRYKSKAGRMISRNDLEASIDPSQYPVPNHDNQRLIVACGLGVDSFAMLAAMKKNGVRPDMIHWADTGSENLHTLRAFNYLQAWCKQNDFPPIAIVRRFAPKAGHRSLLEQAWNLKTLPDAAFGKKHTCSVSWKLTPQRRYDEQCPWLWETGENPKTAIGFDAEEMDDRRGVKQIKAKEAVGFDADEFKDRKSGSKAGSYTVDENDKYDTWFPLAEYGMGRQDCVDAIKQEGLPNPGKSSCIMCPYMQSCEIKQLHELGDASKVKALHKRYQDHDPEHHITPAYRASPTWTAGGKPYHSKKEAIAAGHAPSEISKKTGSIDDILESKDKKGLGDFVGLRPDDILLDDSNDEFIDIGRKDYTPEKGSVAEDARNRKTKTKKTKAQKQKGLF